MSIDGPPRANSAISRSLARSYLYVPGDNAAMLARAAGRGADALILDLEDSVAAQRKAAARNMVAEHLATGLEGTGQLWVRLNAPTDEDLDELAEDLAVVASPRLCGFLVPKTEYEFQLASLSRLLDDIERGAGLEAGHFSLVALVESAKGLASAPSLATAARVVRLQLGEADLAADLGLEPGSDEVELLGPRSEIVRAARLGGLDPPAGSVSLEVREPKLLEQSSRRLRRLGFFGRAVIHPNQIETVNRVFSPNEEERRRAEALLERFEAATAAGHGATVDEQGRMIDEAVARKARLTLGISSIARAAERR